MAVKFNKNRKEIQKEGTYIFEIISVLEVTIKQNKKKIVIKTNTYDLAGYKYEQVDIWFNCDIGAREKAFLNVVGNPEYLEATIGKRFMADVTFYEDGNKRYINTWNFAAVEEDFDEVETCPF